MHRSTNTANTRGSLTSGSYQLPLGKVRGIKVVIALYCVFKGRLFFFSSPPPQQRTSWQTCPPVFGSASQQVARRGRSHGAMSPCKSSVSQRSSTCIFSAGERHTDASLRFLSHSAPVGHTGTCSSTGCFEMTGFF